MYRLRGPSETIRETVPPLVTEGFALLTELGGVAVLVTLLAVLYWVDERESTAVVIGYALVALALVLTLKEWFALPRPPASVRAIPVDEGSHGFPSGHAISSTVVYGGLLLARERWRDWRYAVPTAVLVALIGVSRVVIGVHYVADILVGHAIGLALLVELWVTVGKRPAVACGIAAVVSVAGLIVTSGGEYALLAFGGSLGGALAFRSTETAMLPRPESAVGTVAFVAVGLVFAGLVFVVARQAPFAPLVVLANAVLVAGIVVLPRILSVGSPLQVAGE